MDDILNPKRAAKVKATYGQPPDQSDTDGPSEEQDSDTHDTGEDTEEDNSEDQESPQASDHVPIPGCRRSSRNFSNDLPNYDVRYVLLPLPTVASGRHSIVDNIELGSIPPLIRLCVQLLHGLHYYGRARATLLAGCQQILPLPLVKTNA